VYSWNPFSAGHAEVKYGVTNTGNVRVQSTDTITSAGPFGLLSTDAAAAKAREVLPRSSYQATRTVGGLWPVIRVRTTVTATPSAIGDDDLGSASLTSATVVVTTWVIPWPQLILIGVIAALFWLIRRARSRRRAAFNAALARAREEAAASARHGDIDEPAAAP